MNSNYYRIYIVLTIAILLQACAAAIITGGAAGVSLATDQRTAGTVIDDQSIELKAFRALSDNKEISEKTHLNVTSYDYVVLVTGEAVNKEIRQQVIDILRHIRKVKAVKDYIAISSPSSLMSRSSDALITSKVKARLLATKKVKSMGIKVVTDKGVVYLMGIVTREQARMATEIARTTAGVQKVVMLFEYTD